MRVCVLDTETTGLFKDGHVPYAVQVSYIILNTSGIGRGRVVVKSVDSIVRISNDVELSENSIKIHGITREKSEREGRDMKVVLEDLRDDIQKNGVKLLVGHNIKYDLRVLDVECRRNGWDGILEKGLLGEEVGAYCTAKESVGICNVRVEGKSYLKYVKLIELYEHLFREIDAVNCFSMIEYEKYLHDSRMDVLVCARIYIMLSYSVDMYLEWRREMETYIRKNNLRRSSRINHQPSTINHQPSTNN